MKMEKHWKRFFTLDRHHAEGFTLVELIVVIAILAILGGVAVPAYSGYIKKANQQTDISLASEIEQALLLAHYSNALKPGATVTVYYGEDHDVDVTADSGAHEAMVAAFGESYATTLRLAYGDWDMGPAGDASMMQNVENSNFSREDMDTMLGQVDTVVNAFSGYITGMIIDENSATYKYMQMAGVTGNVVTEQNATAIGNAAVFGVAGNISSSLDSETAKGDYLAMWAEGGAFSANEEWDQMSKMTADYAYALALANYADSLAGDGSTTYADMLTQGVGVEGGDDKTQIINNIASVKDTLLNGDDVDMSGYFEVDPTTGKSPSETNALAFLAYMDGVSSSADSILDGSYNLNSNNFFSEGAVPTYVDNYFDASTTLQNAVDGAIVFIYNGTPDIFCTPNPAHN